jgi:hypothetical protein
MNLQAMWLSACGILFLQFIHKGGHTMDKPISSFLRTTFLLHMIIGVLLGVFLFLIPGRTLTLLGWVPESVPIPNSEITAPGTIFVDPVITRLLGAALLALAFSGYLGWRASTWGQVTLIVQVELVYCILGSLTYIAAFFLLQRPMPFIGYVLLIVLLAFVAAWAWAYRQETRI